MASHAFILRRIRPLNHTVICYMTHTTLDPPKWGVGLSPEDRHHTALLAFPVSHSVPSAQGVCWVLQPLCAPSTLLHQRRRHCICSIQGRHDTLSAHRASVSLSSHPLPGVEVGLQRDVFFLVLYFYHSKVFQSTATWDSFPFQGETLFHKRETSEGDSETCMTSQGPLSLPPPC